MILQIISAKKMVIAATTRDIKFLKKEYGDSIERIEVGKRRTKLLLAQIKDSLKLYMKMK